MSTAIILAGGFGTRLQTVIKNIPKPMAPIHGRPFLEHLMFYWKNQGITQFILSVGYLHEKIVTYFGNSFHGCQIIYAIEKKPLGTGGALLHALSYYHDTKPVLMMNGDTFFAINYNDFLHFHQTNQSILSLALYQVQKNDRYTGILIDQNEQIISFEDPGDYNTNKCIINGGVYLIDPAIIKYPVFEANKKLSFEQDVFLYLQKQKAKITGRIFDSVFIDIGVPTDYQRASDVLSVRLMSPIDVSSV